MPFEPNQQDGRRGEIKIKREVGKQGWTHQVEQITKEQKVKELGAQARPILRDSLNCSPPGNSVRGILRARILEWVVIPFSRASSPPRDRTQVSYRAGILYRLSHQEALCSQRSREADKSQKDSKVKARTSKVSSGGRRVTCQMATLIRPIRAFPFGLRTPGCSFRKKKWTTSRKGLSFRRESSCPYLVCSYPESVFKGT